MTHDETDPFIAAAQEQDPRTDEVLIDLYAAGDVNALAVLVRRHDRLLHRVAGRVVRNEADAEDVVQSAWVSIARWAAGFEHRCEVQGWLCRVVRNQALDHIRRRAVRATVPLSETFDRAAPGDPIADADDRVLVDDLLAMLSGEQRDAVVLVHMQGLSIVQAAEVLGVAEGTVKSRCGRARRAMIWAATTR